MKSVKDLKITTKEGFSVKNLKRFPSMEWGEEGGLQADLYYNGKKILQLYQAGDGGMANAYYEGNVSLEIKTAALNFLKRVDNGYKVYDFLIKKTPKAVNDDDFEAVINNIEERYDNVKVVKSAFKKGYKSVAAISNDYETKYLQFKPDNITLSEVKVWLRKNNMETQYPYISLFNTKSNLEVM